MVNHVRTLLMDRGAKDVPPPANGGWMCDASFVSVDAGRDAEAVRSAVFRGCDDPCDMAAVVSSVMPFLLDPEFRLHMGAYDTRATVPSDRWPERSRRGTVRSFHASSRSSVDVGGIVSRCLDPNLAPRLFDHVGRDEVDGRLDDLKTRYTSSMETSKRFSSVMHALVARTEHARLAGRGR